MVRFARVVAIDARRHITQRGNARQFLFECDPGRLVYLDLPRRHCRLDRLNADSMLRALKHPRAHWNIKGRWRKMRRGRLW
jgi:hypothetical protein